RSDIDSINIYFIFTGQPVNAFWQEMNQMLKKERVSRQKTVTSGHGAGDFYQALRQCRSTDRPAEG
ncbi:MAG: hypothetical protein K6E42_08380, partial [Synergistes sp.]|nr:hypothetical protein [Synergistes sp.]